jgi:hypothetical protein
MLTKFQYISNMKKLLQVRILTFYTASVSSSFNRSPWATLPTFEVEMFESICIPRKNAYYERNKKNRCVCLNLGKSQNHQKEKSILGRRSVPDLLLDIPDVHVTPSSSRRSPSTATRRPPASRTCSATTGRTSSSRRRPSTAPRRLPASRTCSSESQL